MNVAIDKGKTVRLLNTNTYIILGSVRLLLLVPAGRTIVGEARERYSSPSPTLARPVLRLGQTLVDWRLEAPDMFHRHVF